MPFFALYRPSYSYPRLFAIVAFGFVGIFSGLLSAQQGSSGPASKTEFWVSDHESVGSMVKFRYFTPYPGVTKVRLLDSEGNLLWRNQYNDSIGYQARLYRWHLLNPGTYCFKFTYKLEEEVRCVNATGTD